MSVHGPCMEAQRHFIIVVAYHFYAHPQDNRVGPREGATRCRHRLWLVANCVTSCDKLMRYRWIRYAVLHEDSQAIVDHVLLTFPVHRCVCICFIGNNRSWVYNLRTSVQLCLYAHIQLRICFRKRLSRSHLAVDNAVT